MRGEVIRVIHELSPEFEALLLQVLDSSKIERELKKINGRLEKIMATQAEFDAQIQAANTALDSIATDVTNIGAAVTAEAQQIADFLASLPAGTDTSAMTGVVDRLNAASSSLSGAADAIGGIFTPPTP